MHTCILVFNHTDILVYSTFPHSCCCTLIDNEIGDSGVAMIVEVVKEMRLSKLALDGKSLVIDAGREKNPASISMGVWCE